MLSFQARRNRKWNTAEWKKPKKTARLRWRRLLRIFFSLVNDLQVRLVLIIHGDISISCCKFIHASFIQHRVWITRYLTHIHAHRRQSIIIFTYLWRISKTFCRIKGFSPLLPWTVETRVGKLNNLIYSEQARLLKSKLILQLPLRDVILTTPY